MIVHLCSDDSLIDEYVIDTFNELNPKENIFIIISKNKSLKYIKRTEDVILLDPFDPEILIKCNESQGVIVHALYDNKGFWVSNIDKEINVLWSSWGKDLYELNVFNRKNFKLFEKLTQQVKNKRSTLSFRNILFDKLPFFSSFYYFITELHPIFYSLMNKTYNRFNYVTTIIPSEFRLVKTTFPVRKNIKYLDFNYGNLESVINEFYMQDTSLGQNIIIGNSATYPNNHLDIFDRLKTLNIDTKIICPLNYGDSDYISIVKEDGENKFKNNFQALEKYLPLNEYSRYLTSCSAMIMNHRRQQGTGNIILGLYLGMKVYLNKKSPVFSFLKEHGFIFFDFYTDFKNSKENLTSLTKSERNHNRIILEKIWGKKVVEQQILNTIKTLTSSNNG